MASEPDSPEISSLFESIVRNRDLSLFMPFLFGFTNNFQNRVPDRDNENRSERIFLVNPFTQSMVVIEGSSRLEALLRELGGIGKDGQPPASRASIEALPTVELIEEELPCECVICLEEWEIGGLAKQLPCKHKFHPNCIEKWLGIHGSCPVCRHKMPVEDDGDGKKNDVGGSGTGRRVREIWVGFSFNNHTPTHDSNPIPSDHQVVED